MVTIVAKTSGFVSSMQWEATNLRVERHVVRKIVSLEEGECFNEGMTYDRYNLVRDQGWQWDQLQVE